MGPLGVKYLFVDGECLNVVLQKIGDRYLSGARPALDWERLRTPFRKVFYYDGIPVQREMRMRPLILLASRPSARNLREIETQPGYHVRTGEARHRRGRGNQQKMVDVQLAVDALLMASRGWAE